jgi:cytochrome d ubiquinol oxidase subunit II
VLVAVALAAVIVLPGFALLYALDQKGLLPEEGIDDASDQPLDRSPVDHIRRPTDP